MDVFSKEHDSTIAVSEVGCSAGSVHGLVDDFDFFDIFIFLKVEVGISAVDYSAQCTTLFNIFLIEEVVKIMKHLV